MNKQIFIPFTKSDEDQRMVYGYASTEALDSQGEIVSLDALKAALPDYMKFANVREMHTNKAAGKVKESNIDKNGWFVGVKVVADDAWKLVKEGVYGGFSIGGKVLEKVDEEITKLKLSEISLVDRPANPEAVFSCVKFDGDTMKNDKKIEKTEEVEEKVEEIKTEETPTQEKVEEKSEVTEMEEAEKSEKPELKKSLWDVSRLAEIINELNWLEENIEDEGSYENDPMDAEFAGKLSAQIKTLGGLLVERAQRETQEEDEEEVGEKSDKSETLTKLNEISELLKSLNKSDEAVDSPEAPVVEEKPAETVVEATETKEEVKETEKIEKIYQPNIEKIDGLMSKVDELTAKVEAFESLKERLEKVEKAAMPVKVATFAVERFEKSEKTSETELLNKVDEVAAKLKADPFNASIQKEANSLQDEIMASRR